MKPTTDLLRTGLRLSYRFTQISVADLLERATGWAESWATNSMAENPEAIEADAALAREALAAPSVGGFVYLTQEQFDASVRVLRGAMEYARANDYETTGDDAVEVMLGQDKSVPLFHWEER